MTEHPAHEPLQGGSTSMLSRWLAGVLAGPAALALDLAFVYLILGYLLPVAWAELGLYTSFALGLTAVSGVWARRAWRARDAFAVVLVALYLPTLFFRVVNALTVRFSSLAGVATAGLVLVGFAVWIWGLRRMAGPSRAWFATVLAAISIPPVFLLNKHRLYSPTAAEALATDAAIVVAVTALSLLVGRWRHAVPAVAVGIAATAGAWALFAVGVDPAPPTQAEVRPNLLLIVIDTLRGDVFDEVIENTAEGRGFAEAMRGAGWFRNAVASAPWTAPAVASMMTGLYPSEHGHEIHEGRRNQAGFGALKPLAGSAATLAESLRERGYRNEAIVTNSQILPDSGLHRGFAPIIMLYCMRSDLTGIWWLAAVDPAACTFYADARQLRRTLNLRLDSLARSPNPYFLWIHATDPHEPLTAHPELSPDPGGPRLSEKRALYRDEVRFVLRETAAMLAALDERGLLDNTVIVVTSDHGEMFPSDSHDAGARGRDGSPTTYGHGQAMYDELVRIPLVIRPARPLEADREIDVVHSHIDLRRTISDLLSADLSPVGAQRPALAPWLARHAPVRDTPTSGSFAFVSSNSEGPLQRAIRDGDYKLIVYPSGERPVELYDLRWDPLERTNRASEQPERVARMLELLDNVLAGIEPAPIEEPVEVRAETRERLEALGYAQ